METSHSTQRRSDGVIKTAANLLFSGMCGQIRQGDTLGVWTYNQEIYAGHLPLQRWSTPEQQSICSSILTFLKKQKYEKQPAFSSLRPALDKIIKDSELITIILLSSGEEAMTGTPFDDQISQLYKNWREEQQKARMPFVTVLRAKRGAITAFSVTPSPWQVEIPAWPEPAVAKTAASETALKVQPSTVPPLIVTGKKPKPPETTNSTEAATPDREPAGLNPQNQPLKTTNPTVEAAATAPSRIVPQKPATNSAPEAATILERKVAKTELPQPAPQPTPTPPRDLTSSTQAPKPESISAVAANRTNASISTQSPQKSASPPRDISTGVAAPAPGLLSNKAIWLAVLAVLGVICAILIFLARRPRSGHISLITRSLEREDND